MLLYVSSCYYICVRMLLHVPSYYAICVSSNYDVCVLKLRYMRPQTTMCPPSTRYSTYTVPILLPILLQVACSRASTLILTVDDTMRYDNNLDYY